MLLDIVHLDNGRFRLVAVEDDGTRTEIGPAYERKEHAERTMKRYQTPPNGPELLAAKVQRAKDKAARQSKEAEEHDAKLAVASYIKDLKTAADEDPKAVRDVLVNAPALGTKAKANQPG